MDAKSTEELLNAFEKEDLEKLEFIYSDFRKRLSGYIFSDILKHYNAGLVCRDKSLERFIPSDLVSSTTKEIAVAK